MNVTDALQRACDEAGIAFREIPADGKWHSTDIPDDPKGKGDGRIKLFPDGEGGLVANWKAGNEPTPFFIDDGRNLTAEERRKRDHRREEAIRIAREEEQKKRANAAKKASEIWINAISAGAGHPYLVKKGVKPFDVRIHGESLIVPVLIDNAISSLQFISGDGGKKFLTDGRTNGGYHLIGEVQTDGVICIAEGYATAATIHEATGFPVAAAFYAGNLGAVAVSFRKAFPTASLIVCGDDDHKTEGNPGRTKAVAAAKAVGGVVVFPEFGPNRPEKTTDFNDLATLKGVGAVQESIEAALTKPREVAGASCSGHETTTRTDEAGMLTVPEEDRPCFRVFEKWVEIREAGGKLKPGVYYFGMRESKKSDAPPTMINQYVCSPLHIDAVTFDDQEGNFGRMLRFKTTLGRWRTWAMPMELLKGSGDELRGELLAMGVEIDLASRQMLEKYINSKPPERRVRCALRVGWCGNSYVLPDKVYGPDASEVIYQSGERSHEEHSVGGTLDGWKAGVSARAVGNPLLILALSCAFAGPLLSKCKSESGGVHLSGESSTGKTTLIEAACSIWGGRGFMRTWRATANGLEGAASLFNDCLLALDEIKQANPKDVAEIVYSLGNGRGKQRAGRNGRARSVAQWRCSLLSSGERTIESYMIEGGQTPHAGQLVRLLDIPVDRAFKAWDCLHGFTSGAELSCAIKAAAALHHGHAGRAFLERLAFDTTNFGKSFEKMKALKEFSVAGDDGQPKRAAERFALIALAGELATDYGLTGWDPGDAVKAAGEALQKWISERGSAGNDEPRRIVENVVRFIERNGDSRFTDIIDGADEKCLNRAGWWRNTPDGGREYLFNGDGLREALKGFSSQSDFRRALNVLVDARVLQHDGNQEKRAKRIKIGGTTRALYQIRFDAGLEREDSHES